MKHTIREILAHFAKHAEHTHEAAAQATYDLGHAAGKAEALAEQKAADAAGFRSELREVRPGEASGRTVGVEIDAGTKPPGASSEEKSADEADEGKASTEGESAKAGEAQAGA